ANGVVAVMKRGTLSGIGGLMLSDLHGRLLKWIPLKPPRCHRGRVDEHTVGQWTPTASTGAATSSSEARGDGSPVRALSKQSCSADRNMLGGGKLRGRFAHVVEAEHVAAQREQHVCAS